MRVPRRIARTAALAAVTFACSAAPAHAASGVIVSNPWMRPTLEKQAVAPVYLDITSHRWRRIVEIGSPDAESIVIVDPDATDDRRTKTNFVLDGGTTVRFAPRGVHVEMRNVKRAVKNGETVPLTLTLSDAKENKTSVNVRVQVRGLSPPAAAAKP